MTSDQAHDHEVTRSLECWFKKHARPLPWRTDHRDPYRSLVSELMLQQTQVSRVLEKYTPFLDRFPSVQALAEAPEDEVLAAWSGLGYYRRARLLHACAKAIVEHHDGIVPQTLNELLALPGIG
ncbi:MAG TPA: A/G-specific adenine glycosylase, partial [Phycisphaerales bacterium]|nr:A/G-specific adenine glycosylase [Phycisphaerales bacterium]